MFVFPPGCGFNGIPKKVHPGDELNLDQFVTLPYKSVPSTAPLSVSWNKIPCIEQSKVHQLVG